MSAAEEITHCMRWLSMGKMSVAAVSSLTGESVNTPAFSADATDPLPHFCGGKGGRLWRL